MLKNTVYKLFCVLMTSVMILSGFGMVQAGGNNGSDTRSESRVESLNVSAVVFAKDSDMAEDDVNITVLDHDNNALSGAIVEIDDSNIGTTNSEGWIIEKDVPDGWHSVNVTYTDIEQNKTYGHTNFEISTGESSLYIEIVSIFDEFYDGISPINDVELRVHDQDNNTISSASIYLDNTYQGESDSNGEYIIYNVSDGHHYVKAKKDSMTTPDKEFDIGQVDAFGVDVWDTNYNDDNYDDIRVYVYEFDGPAIQNAEVITSVNGYDEYRYTDQYGDAMFMDVPDGWYNIKVKYNSDVVERGIEINTGDGYLIGDAKVIDIDDDGEEDDICVYVRNEKMVGKSGVDVWLWGNNRDMHLGTTNNEGYLNSTNFAEGSYWLEMNYADWRFGTRVFIGEGPFYWLDVRTGDWDGDANDDDVNITLYDNDVPIADADIYLDDASSGKTNSEGYLILYDVNVGRHFVKAKKLGFTLAKEEFGLGEFRWIDAWWTDADWDDQWNDIEICVRTHDWMEVEGASIYVEGKFIGVTSEPSAYDSGHVIAKDFKPGKYLIKAVLVEPWPNEVVFKNFTGGEGDYQYIDAFWTDANGDGKTNDIQIFVKNQDDEYVIGVELFIDNTRLGKTTMDSPYYIAYNQTPGVKWITARFTEGWQMDWEFRGEGSFIEVEATVYAAHPDGMHNDVMVNVTDQNLNPLEGANVHINGRYIGTTNSEGTAYAYELHEHGPCWVDAQYWDPYSQMELWANDICFIGDEDFMYAESWVTNSDNAPDWEFPNDVEILVYLYEHETGNEVPLEGADIYLLGKYLTTTDSTGKVTIFNLSDGDYRANIVWEDPSGERRTLYWDVWFCVGDHRNFIRAEVWVNGPEMRDVEIRTYRGTDWGEEPLANAKLYHNNKFFGQTDGGGVYRGYNLEPGYYFINITYHDDWNNKDIFGWADFYIGSNDDFLMVDWYIIDARGDGNENDIKFVVMNGNNEPLEGAEIFMHGPTERYDETSSEGKSIIHDLQNGRYFVEIRYFNEVDDVHFGAPGGGPHEQYWSCDIIIGDDGFIWLDIWVEGRGQFGKPDDVTIRVYQGQDKPVEGAEVFINSEFHGKTNYDGEYLEDDFGEGRYWVQVKYWDEYQSPPMELYADGEFFIGEMGGYIWAETKIKDDDGDGVLNDVEIAVYEGNGEPVVDAECYVHGPDELYGQTADAGTVIFKDLQDGYYFVDIYAEGLEGVMHTEIIFEPGSETPTATNITIEFTYPADYYAYKPDEFIAVEGTTTGDVEKVFLLVPADSPEDESNNRGDIYGQPKEYEMVPVKAIGNNGSFDKWLFEMPFNPLSDSDPYNDPPLDYAIPIYARAFNIDGEWAQAKLNIMFTESNISDTDQSGSGTRAASGYYDYPDDFKSYFGEPTSSEIYLTMEQVNFEKHGELKGTYDPTVTTLDLYVNPYYEGLGWKGWVKFQDIAGGYSGLELASGSWYFVPDDGGESPEVEEPDEVIFALVGYDASGDYNYIVSDILKLPEDTGGDYEPEYPAGYVNEFYTWVDFIIGDAGFIYVKAFVYAADDDGVKNDVELKVFDPEGNPIEGAEVYIWDEFVGKTGPDGTLDSHNEIEGMMEGYYPVEVIYTSEEGDVFIGKTEFVIGKGSALKVGTYMKDMDGDGHLNDVEIKVKDLDNNPIANAKIFMDDKAKGVTDETGTKIVKNLYGGRHTVDIITEDYYYAFAEFFSKGHGEEYIYADVFVTEIEIPGVTDPYLNDVLIYVYDRDGNPVSDSDIYFNGIYQGKTTIQGFITLFDQPEGWYGVDIFFYDSDRDKEYHTQTEFRSEGEGGEYVYGDSVVDDDDGDENADDPVIVVYDSEGNPIEGAHVYIDGEYVGNTSGDETTRGTRSFGSLMSTNLELNDLPAGYHTLEVSDPDSEMTSRTTIKSEGAGEDFIYAQAFVSAQGDDGYKNDVRILVRDNFDIPISEATVTINGIDNTADENGVLSLNNFAEGTHWGEIFYEELSAQFSFTSEGDGDGNQAPSATVAMPNDNLNTDSELTFEADGIDPDGDSYVYCWNFGDGSEPVYTMDSTVKHRYDYGGAYVVTMTITDGVSSTVYTQAINIEGEEEGQSGSGAPDTAGFVTSTVLTMTAIVAVIVVVGVILSFLYYRKRKSSDLQGGDEDSDDENKELKLKDVSVVKHKMKKKEKDDSSEIIDCPKCGKSIDVPYSTEPKVIITCKHCSARGRIKNPYKSGAEPIVEPQAVPTPVPAVEKVASDDIVVRQRAEPKPIPNQKSEAETKEKNYESYSRALKTAWKDGKITSAEENLLRMLRKKYDITEDEHEMLESQIEEFDNT